MDFILDTSGDKELETKTQLLGEHEKPYFIDREEKTKAIIQLFEKKKEELDKETALEKELQIKMQTLKIDEKFHKFFADMGWTANILMKRNDKGRKFHFDQMDMETGKLKSGLGAVDVEKEMKKSVIQTGFEKQHVLPNYHTSARKLKAQKKKEREKTKGPEWFNLPAPEVTKELKNDLQVLKMRSALDPKRFYKKNDMEVLPKYFQVGKVMDSPLDHVNQRLKRSDRKRTMVDELLADAEFQKYNKKKYKEIIDDKRKSEYRTFMRAKRQRNKAEVKKNKADKVVISLDDNRCETRSQRKRKFTDGLSADAESQKPQISESKSKTENTHSVGKKRRLTMKRVKSKLNKTGEKRSKTNESGVKSALNKTRAKSELNKTEVVMQNNETAVKKSQIIKTGTKKSQLNKTEVKESQINKTRVKKSQINKTGVQKSQLNKTVKKSQINKTAKNQINKTGVKKSQIKKTSKEDSVE